GESGAGDVNGIGSVTIEMGVAPLGNGDLAPGEVAQASGLTAALDPEQASTRGTGELIAAAVERGAKTVLVAAGGSGTTDGGAGAIEALEGVEQVRIVVLCDVRTPWELAARRFAPQKGADAGAVRRLERRLERLARELPRDPRGVAMGGAAGGLAGGLWARFGAQLVPGAPFVLEALDFDARMLAARAVVVGEGQIDRTTLEGKAAGEIATRARQRGVPAHAIVGRRAINRFDARILDLQEILEASTPRAIEQAATRLAATL
ncbi:MAG: glycerate kinase, partial [Solirubrobacteraceae bacterium]